MNMLILASRLGTVGGYSWEINPHEELFVFDGKSQAIDGTIGGCSYGSLIFDVS